MECLLTTCPFNFDYIGYYFVIYASKRTDFHCIYVDEDRILFLESDMPDLPFDCKLCSNGNIMMLPDWKIVVVYFGDDFFIAKKTIINEKNYL